MVIGGLTLWGTIKSEDLEDLARGIQRALGDSYPLADILKGVKESISKGGMHEVTPESPRGEDPRDDYDFSFLTDFLRRKKLSYNMSGASWTDPVYCFNGTRQGALEYSVAMSVSSEVIDRDYVVGLLELLKGYQGVNLEDLVRYSNEEADLGAWARYCLEEGNTEDALGFAINIISERFPTRLTPGVLVIEDS
jgi:hypothetical protein